MLSFVVVRGLLEKPLKHNDMCESIRHNSKLEVRNWYHRQQFVYVDTTTPRHQ